MKIKFFGLLFALLMLTGCGNGNMINSQNLSRDAEEIADELNIVAMKYQIEAHDKENTNLSIWIEKYENGKKTDEKLPNMSEDYSDKAIDEYVFLFSKVDLDSNSFNIKFYATDEKKNRVSTETYLSKNKISEELSRVSYGFIHDVKNVKIDSNKDINIGLYTLNRDEVNVNTDNNILAYDNDSELQSKLKNYDIAYIIRAKFIDSKK